MQIQDADKIIEPLMIAPGAPGTTLDAQSMAQAGEQPLRQSEPMI
jgi:hypothetical protein